MKIRPVRIEAAWAGTVEETMLEVSAEATFKVYGANANTFFVAIRGPREFKDFSDVVAIDIGKVIDPARLDEGKEL